MCMIPLWDYEQNVPRACGECSQCCKKRYFDWMLRGHLHHCMHGEKPAYFITFTYDEDNNPTVVNKEVAKSLKKRFAYHVGFGCKMILGGEYGEQSALPFEPLTGRPHYHLCAWIEDGCEFNYNCGENNTDAYNPPDLVWPYGKIDVRPLTRERVAYTVGYELKNGKYTRRERNGPNGLILPFTLISQGIGKEYAKAFGKRDMELGYTPLRGYKKPVSRYVQTHSGHCKTYAQLWRIRKNNNTDFKFKREEYIRFRTKSGDNSRYGHLPQEIILTQRKKDIMIVAGKKAITPLKL